ncbi:MAG: penicillin acylase family protein, partial [Phycisphaerales bacterium]|nr:penicillin acylase family protein [Phycisphaerales bacterium]
YQRLLDALLEPAYQDRYAPALIERLRSAAYVHDFVREDVESGRIDRAILAGAVAAAETGFDPTDTWGDLHRLHLDHAIGRVPVLGRGYRFGDIPSPGTLTTIQKAAHRVTGERHGVTYGQDARHISDLSDMDANHFVILGGQDGWLGSAHFLDQIPLWQSGEMIRVPLRESSVRAWAARVIRVEAGAP